MGRTEIVGEIIDRGKELALQFMKESKTTKVPPEKAGEVAYQLSLSTLIFNDLKRAKSAEYEFSFKNAFDLSHNNALLLQVKHSRLCSIEENNSELLPFLDDCDSIPEETPDFTKLAVHLSRFPGVILSSLEKDEPCQLIVYLIDLSHCIGRVTRQAKVKGEPVDLDCSKQNLLLFGSMLVISKLKAFRIWMWYTSNLSVSLKLSRRIFTSINVEFV
uniref:Probable arginine--tRNA ligase, mitochondrial n=1 Tax=Angiostrongylus cantonensis TaxID=6313 RepID=A0A0K0D6G2_ANGCA